MESTLGTPNGHIAVILIAEHVAFCKIMKPTSFSRHKPARQVPAHSDTFQVPGNNKTEKVKQFLISYYWLNEMKEMYSSASQWGTLNLVQQ